MKGRVETQQLGLVTHFLLHINFKWDTKRIVAQTLLSLCWMLEWNNYQIINRTNIYNKSAQKTNNVPGQLLYSVFCTQAVNESHILSKILHQ